MTRYQLPRPLLHQTFDQFRRCGRGCAECQVLWLSSWTRPEVICEVVHPEHDAHIGGFVLHDRWLDAFWRRLGRDNMGVRIQVHTHPGAAFHSPTDDAYPIVHTPGFLSLVVPNFALGPVGFERAYLTEIQPNGRWQTAGIPDRMQLI
jgi:hypothetical protein